AGNVSAPEGRPLIARGDNPWKPNPWDPIRACPQGLPPLAIDGRPSGANTVRASAREGVSPRPQEHRHREMVAEAAGRVVPGVAETPRLAPRRPRPLQPLGDDLDRIRVAAPALVIEQARRNANLVVDQRLAVVEVGAELVRVLAGEQVEQER